MTTAAAMAAAGIAAAMRVHGEPVTLPGDLEVTGIFDPQGDSPSPWGAEVGLSLAVSQQPSAVLLLQEADAVSLSRGDLATIRAAIYRVTTVDQARDGLVRVELTLEPDTTAEGRWR